MASINVTKDELFDMIMDLRDRVDQLTGRPRGPISMTEYRLACERKDRATMRRFLEQEGDTLTTGGRPSTVRSLSSPS